MSELLLMATVAGEPIVLRAADVGSVITVDRLTPVPLSPVHVAGLCALRSRILTAIDCCIALDLAPVVCSTGKRPAIVVEHEGHSYALLVDSVEDVTEALSQPAAVPARLGEGWRRAAIGMVETTRGLLLLVDAGAVIAGPAATRAAA